MNINDSFPSKWLRANDVPEDSDLVLTIEAVKVQTVGQGEDSEEKPVMAFREIDKALVLNKTNAQTISGLYGAETDGWTGKKIALFATEVQFGSQLMMALRVRLKAPKASNGNGNGPTGTSPLWSRYAELAGQARELGLAFPTLDLAASDDEVKAAGKALKLQVEEAQKVAF